jgi:predicted NodU family carbamoyl transferase
MPLILGLHGSFEDPPARGVHDAAYCFADSVGLQVLALVEMEKLSGLRHDGRLDPVWIKAELERHQGVRIELVSSHFTTFGKSPAREFPLFRDLEGMDCENVGFCSSEEISLSGSRLTHFIYLHELAHVFCAYMYRERDDDRFLGWVIEGCGSFTQNALFLIEHGRAKLLEYNLPILSGNFFHQWLSEQVFEAHRDDYQARSATAGKAMALAAYGDPDRYHAPLLSAVKRHKAGEYMNYRARFCSDIEESTLSWKDRVDLCASGQRLFEDLIVEQALRIRDRYGDLPLYYAGGCALSIKVNSRLRRIFSRLTIPPNCGDDGIALGLAAAHAFLQHRVLLSPLDHRSGLMSADGDDFTIHGRLSDEDVRRVVQWLDEGEVIAFAQGSPEIGPRALCRRSILADPSIAGMQDVLNHIKGREYFRPVAAIVLDSAGRSIFKDYAFSPFMLYDFHVRPEWRGMVPAGVHTDGTTRVQSITDDDSDIAGILRAYASATQRPPVLLNTSLNSRGRPIASTPRQVMAEMSNLKIKHLVLGDRVMVIDCRFRAEPST